MKTKNIIPSILGGLALTGVMLSVPTKAISKTAEVSYDNPLNLSLILSTNKVDFNMEGELGLVTNTMTVRGETNNIYGFTISLNTDKEYNSLKNDFVGSAAEIPSVTEDTPAENFPTLGWGYSLNKTTFKEVPVAPLNLFATPTFGAQTYDFTTGVRVAEMTESGAYSNDLVFTIVANTTPASLEIIGYMQDMTPDICAATEPGTQKQLIDKRDGKRYWVYKTTDTLDCWMLQNLDFELYEGLALDPETTNVHEPKTITFEMLRDQYYSPGWQEDRDDPRYIDGGDEYFVRRPSEVQEWIETPSGTYEHNENYEDLVRETLPTTNLAADSVKWQNHVGSRYDIQAATVSSTDRILNELGAMYGIGQFMSIAYGGSICPTGWHIPAYDRYSEYSWESNDPVLTNSKLKLYLLDEHNVNGLVYYEANSGAYLEGNNADVYIYYSRLTTYPKYLRCIAY